jgi:hypothetical protein
VIAARSGNIDIEMKVEDITFDLQDKVTMDVVGAIAPKLEQAEIERSKLRRLLRQRDADIHDGWEPVHASSTNLLRRDDRPDPWHTHQSLTAGILARHLFDLARQVLNPFIEATPIVCKPFDDACRTWRH